MYTILRYAAALVWIANGLFCKLLNLVPRHEQIVARILGDAHAHSITRAIGLAEIVMAIWIFSGIRKRLNAIIQIIVVAVMNTIEYFLASDLLLWGKVNALFALIFIGIIYWNEFKLTSKMNPI